jgi:CRISPR system Cascade subunit CasC
MFIQIHMLQSMPPGNLNRDETGQPKKCLFGGVTRGRISSQCLKRNIRHSTQFKDAFGDTLASRTTYLPRMVADELRKDASLAVPAGEIGELGRALAGKFKSEKPGDKKEGEGESEDGSTESSPSGEGTGGQTGQLVFFPAPFARRIAELAAEFRQQHPRPYEDFIGRELTPKITGQEKKETDKFVKQIADASELLTVDIGLFGRMTTSDLVVNVEAACQVAHAISTHETIIESDYFTAMDDRKHQYADGQMDKAGAAFLGSGDTETFFNAAVYYKYLNLDVRALRKHLPSLNGEETAKAVGVLLSAAALATPTGKQNSFASHSVPELILVEISNTRRPLSYANAFLRPIEGGVDRNLMTESAKALQEYLDSAGEAFATKDVRRFVLTTGHTRGICFKSAITSATSFDRLIESVENSVRENGQAVA